jgi:hypothetical protein
MDKDRCISEDLLLTSNSKFGFILVVLTESDREESFCGPSVVPIDCTAVND